MLAIEADLTKGKDRAQRVPREDQRSRARAEPEEV